MNTQLKSQVHDLKTRYILGVEVFSRENMREFIFDKNAEYSNCFSINEITVFSFLRLPVYKIKRQHDVINHFLFGFKIKSETVAEIFYKRCLQQIDIEYDDAYIMRGGSGEPFRWIAYAAKAHFAKNNSKLPLVIVHRASFGELINMYLPGVQYFVSTRARGAFDTENLFMEFDGHKFFVNCLSAKNSAYLALNTAYQPDIYPIFKDLSLSGVKKNDLNISDPVILNVSKDKLEKKIDRLNLRLDNFVILSPEANSFLNPPIEFWEIVTRKFNNMGTDVFLNFINENNYIPECIKFCAPPLPYDEMYVLASKARAVISLRSGFSEIVLPTHVPSIVIHTIPILFTFTQKDRSEPRIPMPSFPFVNEDDISGIWYFDYETNEEAADAVLSCYNEMMKNRSSVNENPK